MALMLVTAGSAAVEPQDQTLVSSEAQLPLQQQVLQPSTKLDKQAELITQQKTDDAMQRIDDQMSREMNEQLSQRYAISD